ncbi:hypothetical protein AX16_008904 [Volvariella volvacea WC 439]|nr:hypothetical protein AX16_008904 [Volvariella volvacea WC 439]
MSNPLSNTLYALSPYNTISKSRLQALYADISRQKSSNPVAYQSSIEWWRKALETIVSSGLQEDNSRLILHAGRRLIDGLKYDGVGKPLALGTVITELQASKSLILRDEFIDATQSIYSSVWLPSRIAAYVVGKPLWWMLEQLGITGEDGIMSSPRRDGNSDNSWWNDYVVIPLVEKAADSVLERQRERYGSASDRLYSMEGFRREFSSVLGEDTPIMNERDSRVLLRFLERDKRAIILGKDVIKFIIDDTSDTRHEISSIDQGILEVKIAIESIQRQVDGLHHKIEKLTTQASEALRQQRKPIALNHIRIRKQYQDILATRLKSLENLEATMLSIESAASNIEIMKTYASSTATLKAVLSHPLLQYESIDKTMDALAEANMDAKEIDDSIRAAEPSQTFDEIELEAELQELVDEARRAETSQREGKLEQLHPPTRDPSPQTTWQGERTRTAVAMP